MHAGGALFCLSSGWTCSRGGNHLKQLNVITKLEFLTVRSMFQISGCNLMSSGMNMRHGPNKTTKNLERQIRIYMCGHDARYHGVFNRYIAQIVNITCRKQT